MPFKISSLLAPVIMAAITVSINSACKKNKDENVDRPRSDAQKIRLKEVSVQGLPSPYFRYTYDADNYITSIHHESGHYQYNIEYKNRRVSRMINNSLINKDTLVYHYTGSNVTRIDVLEPGKGKTEATALVYDKDDKLVKVSWKKQNEPNIHKQFLLYYDAQGNMSGCEIYYYMGAAGLLKTNTYTFHGFDDKVNLTSNYLLKELHYLFLPSVQLQHNNPMVFKMVGIDNDYEYSNTYQYKDSLPVLKTTLIQQTRGSGAGMSRTGTTHYSYY